VKVSESFEPMKTGILLATNCAMLALFAGLARAQDSARVPDQTTDPGSAVDASVRAGVDEQTAQQTQPPRPPNKHQQTPYTHWGFQSASHAASRPPATRFQREQTRSLIPQPENTEEPSKLSNSQTRSEKSPFNSPQHGQDNLFGSSPITGAPRPPSDADTAAVRGILQKLNTDNPPQLQGLKSINPLPSPFPHNNGLSPALDRKKAEPSNKEPIPSPFAKPDNKIANPLQPKPRKHTPPKPADRTNPTSLLGSQPTKQN
jgi:hypothetical protein